jgi:hypothetical protein
VGNEDESEVTQRGRERSDTVNELQQRVARRLALLGPGPVAFYCDACQLLNDAVARTSALTTHSPRAARSSRTMVCESFRVIRICRTCRHRS